MKRRSFITNKFVYIAIFSPYDGDKEARARRISAVQEATEGRIAGESGMSLISGYSPETNSETALLYVSDVSTITEFMAWLCQQVQTRTHMDWSGKESISFDSRDRMTIIQLKEGRILDAMAIKGDNSEFGPLFITTGRIRERLGAQILYQDEVD